MRCAHERFRGRRRVAALPAKADIAGRLVMQLRRALRQRGAAVDHGGKRLEVDVHGLRAAIPIRDLEPIVTREYGCQEFTLRDPDSHVIVFGQCD